ncbi:MAG: hypothetical protein AAB296_04550, partial [Candidatus Desantisbacteria bacterium]
DSLYFLDTSSLSQLKSGSLTLGGSLTATGIITAPVFVGSATDSDKLDGRDSLYFLDTSSLSQVKSGNLTLGGSLTAGGIITAPVFVGSATDSDKLDGRDSLYFLDTSTTYQTKEGSLSVTGEINTGQYYKIGDNKVFSTPGDYNTFLGNTAGYNNTEGAFNTFLGYGAGHNNITGNNNLFLGYNAGYSETGSNKLYIDNSDTTNPLIWGDFETDGVKINGSLTVTGPLTAMNFFGVGTITYADVAGTVSGGIAHAQTADFATDSTYASTATYSFDAGTSTWANTATYSFDADRLDGKEALELEVGTATIALDSDRLDGKDSADFIDTSADAQTKTGTLNLSDNLTVNGNLGIGTTIPMYKLDVNGTGIVAKFQGPHDGNEYMGVAIVNENSAVQNWLLGAKNDGSFVLHQCFEADRITVLNGGNVGIGMTPAHKLDVAGDIHATVQITAD